MGIGYRIKEARERLGLTQTELGHLVGVTGSAITNYEKETSHPKEQVIYRLMETLDVDANYLFQDMIKIKHHRNTISPSEYDFIQKYRELDERGKAMVDSVLEQAYYSRPYVMDGQIPLEIGETIHTKFGQDMPNAAHARTDIKPTADDVKHDEDVMDDDNF